MKNGIIAVICLVIAIILIFLLNNFKKSAPSQEDAAFNRILNSLGYECDLLLEGWPDAIFEIEFSRLPDNELKKKLLDSLVNLVEEYNKKVVGEGVIHYVSEIDDSKEQEKMLTIHIDFGSANPTSLGEILKHFDRAEFGVVRVSVY